MKVREDAAKAAVEGTSGGSRVQVRRAPPSYVDEWFEAVESGDVMFTDVARTMGKTIADISRWHEWCLRERDKTVRAANWEMGPDAKRALNDFRFFRERYFVAPRAPFKGKPFVTEPFHMRWIDAILACLPEEAGGTGGDLGGQQLILSPPRMGKTMLLAHLVIWLMLRNPDVVIIWIAKSESLARESGSVVRDELERNEKLRLEFLGPDATFKPETRTGAAWRDDEFELGTRTLVQKAPTFRALGRGGTLQSVDADFIVTDDIEDHDSTRTQHQRQSNLEWMLTEVESRKEMHTAWLYIGSRNHPQDVADHLLKSDDWESIVESAHDRDCEKPVDVEDAHTDCMLWPRKFPYSELQKKMRVSGEQIVQMRYLNDPVGDGITVFVEQTMRGCLDHSRVLGQIDLPAGYQILGSIDPSPGAHQVAELWAFSTELPVRFLIDVFTGKGGMDAWEELVKAWLVKYGLNRWVVEDNSAQSDYINRREFQKWRQDNAVHVHPHTTGRNKHSMGHGVASMHPLYVNKQIVLPYGDFGTQGKMDAFIREHVNYDPDRAQRTTKFRTDRVVAAWFANTYMDSLQGGRLDVKTTSDMDDGFLSIDGMGMVEQDFTGGWL